MKECRYCHKSYPELYFHIARTTPEKVYRRRKCRFCYKKTKDKLEKKYKDWIEFQKIKSGCVKCRISDIRVLDFHHKNDKNKKFCVTDFKHQGAGFDRIKEKAAKCEVICANCHRILHHEKRIRQKHR